MKSLPLVLLLALLLPRWSAAQTNNAATGLTDSVTLPTSVRPEIPTVSLALKATEAIRTFVLTVRNDEEVSLKVFGAQTTSGLYVVDYPREIAAKGQASATLLYVARQNSTATTDLLRLMTDRGEKVIQLEHGRDPLVQFDVPGLQWQQNERPAPKSVIVTVLDSRGGPAPKGVRALGAGNSATVETIGEGRYRITVTPGSTAVPGQFPVMIQFVPTSPGLPTVLSCVVAAKE